MVETIHALTAEATAWKETTTLIGQLNRTLRGWAKVLSSRHRQQSVPSD
jgi:RNA-directed DNA polymerase